MKKYRTGLLFFFSWSGVNHKQLLGQSLCITLSVHPEFSLHLCEAASGSTLHCLLKGWWGDVSRWQAFVVLASHRHKIGKKSWSQLAFAVLTPGVICFQHFFALIRVKREKEVCLVEWKITNMQCHVPSVCSLLSAGLAALCTVQWKITIEWEIAGFVALLIKQDSRLIRKNVAGMGVEPLGKCERWWLHLKC